MKQFTQKRNTLYGQVEDPKNPPVAIKFNAFNENEIEYADGTSESGICLNCLTHPCMDYSQEEISIEILDGMPYANSTKVCPTNAIFLNANGFPEINAIACFGCGLCMTRCIYGAISLTHDFGAYINQKESNQIAWISEFSMHQQTSRDSLYEALSISVENMLFSKAYFTHLYEKMPRLIKGVVGFDNLFVRNLFLNLGVRNKVRAVGNNDIRFDLLGRIENLILVGEIGLDGTDILQEPRAILDDLAVLKSRYNIDHASILPLIITLTFPNKRSDVYEVITDIKSVLGIRVLSISVHLLIILNLLRRRFDKTSQISPFYIDKDELSLVNAALQVIPELEEVDPFLHHEFYRPIK